VRTNDRLIKIGTRYDRYPYNNKSMADIMSFCLVCGGDVCVESEDEKGLILESAKKQK